MAVLPSLLTALADGTVSIVDLTVPLSEDTPIIALPPERGQPSPLRVRPISHYDALGPEVYWNNIELSEHTGTHFDAPIHWVSGREGEDVSQVPASRLVAPAVVLDVSGEVAANPEFLLTQSHVEAWVDRHGPLPNGGWLLYRTGWGRRHAQDKSFLNGGSTPGVEPACARWLAEETPIVGLGVETVGTDAGRAGEFDPPYPCHWFFHRAGKYGLTQLHRLDELPVTGALLVAGPLPLIGGSGSPCRVLALVER